MKHGSWILGGGWNNDLWGGELPLASWIDDITGHNPVRMLGSLPFQLLTAFAFAYFNVFICRCGYQGWMVTWDWQTHWH